MPSPGFQPFSPRMRRHEVDEVLRNDERNIYAVVVVFLLPSLEHLQRPCIFMAGDVSDAGGPEKHGKGN